MAKASARAERRDARTVAGKGCPTFASRQDRCTWRRPVPRGEAAESEVLAKEAASLAKQVNRLSYLASLRKGQ
eukprot:5624521-Alexandrium_andersonii.AAC.1